MSKDKFDYNSFWSYAFDDMDDFIFLIDEDFTLRRINKTFADFLGKSRDEIEGLKCFDVMHQDKKPVPACPHMRLLKSGRFEKDEIFESKFGCWFATKTVPILDDERNIRGCIHITTDVTEKRQAQEVLLAVKEDLEVQTWGLQKTNEAIKILYKELEKKNEELRTLDQIKSDFISVVSHELRTPLTTIKEAVSQVLDGILGDITPDQRDFLDIAYQDVDRLSRIVNDLLDMSRIEAKKFNLNRSVVDLVKIVKGVMSSFSLLCQEKGIKLEGVFSNDVIEAFVDSDKIVQVFTNLIGNALKFTNRGSIKVVIEDFADGDLKCRVVDSGCGIAEEDLGKVFDKFQQIGRTAGAGAKGTGLGLAISKAIVELHGGDISVGSELNKGTSFMFSLPRFNTEIVLRKLVQDKIEVAKAGFSKLLVFAVRLCRFKCQIQADTDSPDKSVYLKILRELNSVSDDIDIVVLENSSEIFALLPCEEGKVDDNSMQILKAVKRAVFDLYSEGILMDFMYGNSVYPDDDITSDGLIERVGKDMVDEETERLQKRILIVDDEKNMVNAIRRLLSGSGYVNISEAYDGMQALESIKKSIPDLIILDMKMPNMNGYEVIGRLKEDMNTKDIPVLIVSGTLQAHNKWQEFAKVRTIPMVSKPFDNKDIERWVKFLL